MGLKCAIQRAGNVLTEDGRNSILMNVNVKGKIVLSISSIFSTILPHK